MMSPEVMEIVRKTQAERRKGLAFYDKDPGSGAIEYAQQFIEGVGSRLEMLSILSQLLDGELHDADDRRVKRCDYCGYYWRDDSKRNNRKTCSDDCKTGIKTLQRRKQRERQDLVNPNPKPNKRKLQDDYVDWIEYPYWSNEYSMLKVCWKHEPPKTAEKMDYFVGNREIWGGGNRKVKTVNYDESEAEESYDDHNWNDRV